jgi:hypothetical protein
MYSTHGSLARHSGALSADVQLANTNQWYDGPSVTLPAGTWLVRASATFIRNTTGVAHWTGRISDKTNHFASGQQYTASVSGIAFTMSVEEIITLASTTDIFFQASTNAGNAAALMKAAAAVNGVGNNATRITAIRLA